ncbi:hypothetical protein ZIOFF_014099 [Zingiber officinale]|uniref:Protein BIG GRAIN 1-like E n=1 Tax=Zingiber officinale TaxID=94328 RepID=A0A8J5LLD5_ZINOF|nr:hypothetical protein ZIOFF_014099 [Zingiber officinale]
MNSPYEYESDELDVFEATRYFSGAIDGMAGGFVGSRGLSLATEEREVPYGVQQRRLGGDVGPSPPPPQVKEKKWKRPSSPGAKLVSYLNHFFNQATPRKTLKCLNPSSTAGEKAKEGKEMQNCSAEQSERRRRRRRSDALSYQSSKSSANFCGSSSFASPSSQKGITLSDFETWGSRPGGEESKWVINKPISDGRLRRDWFHRGHHQLPFERASKDFTHFTRARREEINHDDEEDGDDDLFELKNIYAQEDLSDGLPVFATTNIEVIKRKTAISSTAS